MICILIKKHIENFYDNIYIPYIFFKKNDWDIKKTLLENKDILYYNEKYLINDDKKIFNNIFKNYVKMIEKIMSNELYIYLKKEDNNLKKIINSYPISPIYIIELYKNNKIDELDEIMEKVKKEKKKFKIIFKKIIKEYVYNTSKDLVYKLGFINSVLMEILKLADKLIKLNVYAIHSIISNIIDDILPLDEIFEKELIII